MKILIQYPLYGGIGGISRYIENFLGEVNLDTNDEIILLTNSNFDEKIRENIKVIRIPLSANRWGLFLWSIRSRQIINRLIKNKQVDLVNTHVPPLIPALLLWGCSYIVTLHGTLELHEMGRKLNPLERFTRSILESIILHNSKKIIVLTNRVADEIKRYNLNNNKISICPNSVDSNYFKSKKTQKIYDLIMIGRLVPEKGSKSIPLLCKQLVKLKKNIRIAIVGAGQDFDYIKQQLVEEIRNKNVILFGEKKKTQVKAIYQKSKLYVSCSYYEGLPGTCLEAMSMSLPVIGWNKEFYDGLILNNVNGYLIKTDDYMEMCKKVIYLLNNSHLLLKTGNNGRNIIIDKYDSKLISIKLEDILLKYKR